MHVGVKVTAGKCMVGDWRGVWRPGRVRSKLEKVRWNRHMIVGVHWRNNDDDPEVDCESLKGDVGDGQRLQRKSEGAHHARGEHLGFTGRCPGCVSMLRGTARHTL